MRMAFLDEGPRRGPVALCLHGNPTWSYVYRKMIPVFLRHGFRVVAPDLIGFGRSDHPVDEAVHTFAFHRGSLIGLIEHLDLRNIMLVCHDWGGILGLTLPMDLGDRFTRLLIMNTGLSTDSRTMSSGLNTWRDYLANTEDLAVGRMMLRAEPVITEAEAEAYDTPFDGANTKSGVRGLAKLQPFDAQAPGGQQLCRARAYLSKSWRGESFMAYGALDPVFGMRAMLDVQSVIRGCPEPVVIGYSGHFVQEHGRAVAAQAMAVFGV